MHAEKALDQSHLPVPPGLRVNTHDTQSTRPFLLLFCCFFSHQDAKSMERQRTKRFFLYTKQGTRHPRPHYHSHSLALPHINFQPQLSNQKKKKKFTDYPTTGRRWCGHNGVNVPVETCQSQLAGGSDWLR